MALDDNPYYNFTTIPNYTNTTTGFDFVKQKSAFEELLDSCFILHGKDVELATTIEHHGKKFRLTIESIDDEV